ncbi:ABC transporter permease [Thiomicrorhabdus sp. ZW0627]|uniref:ABC transporter permease n=1 Tax=Thiomicrorhabdus sp. ZW0627 TaxID=3039774 RepID=UPI002436B146|nr:ABC transporter permease [Thiomicrorhabdus sp. ZW0627]MDG6773268.1 ABC transporter permease [Thiomicrorhabdus sp. ZW0627]
MIWNALVLAIREIRRNLMRSFLTVLGIVIGVASVITMVTLGSGATLQVTQDVASLGSNLLSVRPGQRISMGVRSASPSFKLDDALAIERDIRGVKAAAPISSSAVTAVYGNENWSTTVHGTTLEYFTVREWNTEFGRVFTDAEVRSGRALCVIGTTVQKELFGDLNPVGNKIRFNKMACQVIGVLESKGQSSFGSDQDDLILMPLKTFQRRISGNSDVGRIQVAIQEGLNTAEYKTKIERLLRERRHLSPNEDNNFSVTDMKEIASMLSNITKVMTMLLGAVAAVSLLVGGIGIMNIMLVSVTERTREIGIRLAIGALEKEVLLQFLVESIVLSSFGGLFGILLAVIASYIFSVVMSIPLVFNPLVILMAFAFSALIGVIFGYFPARKAARLDPIVALRHE